MFQVHRKQQLIKVSYIRTNMGFFYSVTQFLAWYCTNLFFRDVTVINKENVPIDGPTIIYGNHNNQFVDGMLMKHVLNRPVSFIAAAKSVRRNFVGHLIKAAGAIPVERPQDVEKVKGPGTILEVEGNRLKGLNTHFTKLTIGTIIYPDGLPELKIKEIISDVEIILEHQQPNAKQLNLTYKYLLKLDYTALYEYVWQGLKNGKCLGMFPEGGSHDRLQLLPLKAGICFMALGAMQKYGISVKLVPLGFNYYNPQKFRSKAILEFGPAYQIPPELLQLYKRDKKKAVAILLQNLQKMLKAVTIQFYSYGQLFGLFTARNLYAINSRRQITTKEKLQLNRRFAKGYMMLRDNQKYADYYKSLLEFSRKLQLSGIHLRKQDYYGSRLFDSIKFVVYFQKCLLRSIIALPGVILMGPTTTLIAYLAERQRLKCLKGSKVKMFGNDVVGSYKILLSLVLMPLTCAAHSGLLFMALKKYTSLSIKTIAKLSIGLFVLQPLYALIFVKSYDSFKTSFQKLKLMFMRLFNPNSYDQFNRQKKQLQTKIMMIVEQQGKRVVQNFQSNRILKKEELAQSGTQLYIFDKQQLKD